MFRKYHYLNTSLNKSAKCFIGLLNGKPVTFFAMLHFPHPKVKNGKIGHRIVTLPDYQGVGIGVKVQEYIADWVISQGYRYFETNSHPAVIAYRVKSPKWILKQQGRKAPHRGLKSYHKRDGRTPAGYGRALGSSNRLTTSWEYVGDRDGKERKKKKKNTG